MRRIAVAAVAISVGLVAATPAGAAIDSYTASYAFKGRSGTTSQPTSLSFTQKFSITAATFGARTGILTDIKSSIADVSVDTSGLPTCSLHKITAALDDAGCPRGALVATGSITASLGSPSPFTAATGDPCDPALDVWNAGRGRLVLFPKMTPSHQCLGGEIHTGAIPPFGATYRRQAGDLVVDVPVPSQVTHIGPYVASVSSEFLKWTTVSRGLSYSIASTGCAGQRRYTSTFSVSTPTGKHEKVTTKGSAACG